MNYLNNNSFIFHVHFIYIKKSVHTLLSIYLHNAHTFLFSFHWRTKSTNNKHTAAWMWCTKEINPLIWSQSDSYFDKTTKCKQIWEREKTGTWLVYNSIASSVVVTLLKLMDSWARYFKFSDLSIATRKVLLISSDNILGFPSQILPTEHIQAYELPG